jgi:hypothetical protein
MLYCTVNVLSSSQVLTEDIVLKRKDSYIIIIKCPEHKKLKNYLEVVLNLQFYCHFLLARSSHFFYLNLRCVQILFPRKLSTMIKSTLLLSKHEKRYAIFNRAIDIFV